MDGGGRSIKAAWPAELTAEDAAVYLLGPVLGFLLRLRGAVCLHAGVVRIGGRTLTLAGRAGGGKSTLCAALSLRGHDVLSDDVAALSANGDRFCVPAGWPHIRLWPSAVASLFGAADALSALVEGSAWDKRRLDLQPPCSDERPPLDALVFLGRRGTRPPRARALSPGRAFARLVAGTYPSARLPKHLLGRELDVLTGIAARLPAWEVRPHRDIAELPRLCDEIERLAASR